MVAENEPPNSYDPSSGFFAGEDEILVNTYQELVMFNYTSISEFAPILAQNWTVSSNYLNYTFNLRNDAYFANGHPYNASVAWFNFNRVILMGQIGAFYFTNLIYNGTTAFATGYSISNGVDNALASAGYVLSTTNATLRQEQAANDLASNPQQLQSIQQHNSEDHELPRSSYRCHRNLHCSVQSSQSLPQLFAGSLSSWSGADSIQPSWTQTEGSLRTLPIPT